jgi:hypothetical protein
MLVRPLTLAPTFCPEAIQTEISPTTVMKEIRRVVNTTGHVDGFSWCMLGPRHLKPLSSKILMTIRPCTRLVKGTCREQISSWGSSRCSQGVSVRSCRMPRYLSVVWTDSCPSESWTCSSGSLPLSVCGPSFAEVFRASCGASSSPILPRSFGQGQIDRLRGNGCTSNSPARARLHSCFCPEGQLQLARCGECRSAHSTASGSGIHLWMEASRCSRAWQARQTVIRRSGSLIPGCR